MRYKITANPEPRFSKVARNTRCGGYVVGIRNMVLAALTEAIETDFKNSGDRRNFGSAEKSMWGMLDWEDAEREEVIAEIANAVWLALWGRFGANAELPNGAPPITVIFGEFEEDEDDGPILELDRIKDALQVLKEAIDG